MTQRSDKWFDRQLAAIGAVLTVADKQYTQDEITAAQIALAEAPKNPQLSLFNKHVANRGVATTGHPDSAGCDAALCRDPE